MRLLRVWVEMPGGCSGRRILGGDPMVPLPYPRLLGGVSLIYAKGPFWECPVYTLFALHRGGGWHYGLGTKVCCGPVER